MQKLLAEGFSQKDVNSLLALKLQDVSGLIYDGKGIKRTFCR